MTDIKARIRGFSGERFPKSSKKEICNYTDRELFCIGMTGLVILSEIIEDADNLNAEDKNDAVVGYHKIRDALNEYNIRLETKDYKMTKKGGGNVGGGGSIGSKAKPKKRSRGGSPSKPPSKPGKGKVKGKMDKRGKKK